MRFAAVAVAGWSWPHWVLHTLAAFLLAVSFHAAFSRFADLNPEHTAVPARLEVVAKDDGRATGGYLSVKAILADGRLVVRRMEDVPAGSGWSARQSDVVSPPYLVYTGQPGGAPAVVRIPAARTVVVMLEAYAWTGEMRMVGEDGRAPTVHAIAGPASIKGASTLVFGSPVRSGPVTGAVGVFALYFVLAMGFGLHRLYRTLPGAWLGLVLGGIHFLYWSCMPPGYHGDTIGYWDTVQSLLLGSPSFQPPGYSLLLGPLAFAVGEANLTAMTTLLQHAMAVAVQIWVFLLMRRVIQTDFAAFAALLGGIAFPVLVASNMVLTEWPTAFAMTGCLYLAFVAAERDSMAAAAASGLLAGWAGVLRVAPIGGLAPAVLILVWWSPNLVPAMKRVRMLGVFAGSLVFVMAAPMIWFGTHGHGYRLSRSMGYHLYNRAVFDQKLFEPNGEATRQLVALMPGRDFRRSWNWEVSGDPRVRHMSWDELESLVRRCALEAIRANPVPFVAYTPRLAWKLYATPTDWLPTWGTVVDPHPLFDRGSPVLPFSEHGLRWIRWLAEINRRLWPAACWLAIAAVALCWRNPERRVPLAMLTAVGLYLFTSASIAVFAARYNAPVVPLVYALAAVTSGKCMAWVLGRVGLLKRLEFSSTAAVLPEAPLWQGTRRAIRWAIPVTAVLRYCPRCRRFCLRFWMFGAGSERLWTG
jgi:hypothetical protein